MNENKIKDIILFYLEIRRISLHFLAKRSEIEYASLWRFLNNKGSMTLKTVNRLFDFLKNNSSGIEYPEELRGLLS